MEETMGDQEDPAGVKMGRRIPFLWDKLQKKTGRQMPPWAEARTTKHSGDWRKKEQGKWRRVTRTLLMQRGWTLWVSGRGGLCLHDWSPTLSPLGLPLPVSLLQLWDCLKLAAPTQILLTGQHLWGSYFETSKKPCLFSRRLMSRLLHASLTEGTGTHCCYFYSLNKDDL